MSHGWVHSLVFVVTAIIVVLVVILAFSFAAQRLMDSEPVTTPAPTTKSK
jgi:hypothetical protein